MIFTLSSKGFGVTPKQLVIDVDEKEEPSDSEAYANRIKEVRRMAEDAVLGMTERDSVRDLLLESLVGTRQAEHFAAEACSYAAVELRTLGMLLESDTDVEPRDIGVMLYRLSVRLDAVCKLDGRLRRVDERNKTMMIFDAEKKHAAKEEELAEDENGRSTIPTPEGQETPASGERQVG